jgi:hypothetical protein
MVRSYPNELHRSGEARVVRIEHYVRVVEVQDLYGITCKTGERGLEFLPGMLGARELGVYGEARAVPPDD